MKTAQLAQFVLLNALVAFDDNKTPLLAAGPLVKQPSTRPFRVVLANRGSEFVVWTEYLKDDNPDLSQPITCGSFFETGDYYQPHELGKAYKRFAERVERYASTTDSVYRLVTDEAA